MFIFRFIILSRKYRITAVFPFNLNKESRLLMIQDLNVKLHYLFYSCAGKYLKLQ